MSMVKSFKEFIGESIWSDIQDRSAGDAIRREDDINLEDTETLEELYAYLKKCYKPLGKVNIEIADKGHDKGVDWVWLTIPLTTDGDLIETEVSMDEPEKAFSLYVPYKFKKYFDDCPTIYEITDIDWVDDWETNPTCRVMGEHDPMTNEEIVDILDELLGCVPNPGLEKIRK